MPQTDSDEVKRQTSLAHTTWAPLIWMNAFPGTGKLTICRELLKLLGPDKAILIDNHQLIDPVASRLSRDDEQYQPERRLERQRAFKRTVEDEAKAHLTIIFTDFQSENELGRSIAAEYREAAARSCRLFVPICVQCSVEENLKRASSDQRLRSGTTKLTDKGLLSTMRSRSILCAFDLDEELHLDVTTSSPIEAAQKIVNHLENLHGRVRISI